MHFSDIYGLFLKAQFAVSVFIAIMAKALVLEHSLASEILAVKVIRLDC